MGNTIEKRNSSNTTKRIIAALLFVLYAIVFFCYLKMLYLGNPFPVILSAILRNLQNGRYIFALTKCCDYFFPFVSCLIIVIGLLTNKNKITLLGAIIGCLAVVINFVDIIIQIKGRLNLLGSNSLCLLLLYILLVAAIIIKGKPALWMCVIGASISMAIGMYSSISGWQKLHFYDQVTGIEEEIIKDLSIVALAAAVFVMGFVLNDTVGKRTQAKSNAPQKEVLVGESSTDDKIERLTKLKEFLDKGIITQEEFEAKKKQILGL